MTGNNLPALDALADKINSEHAACHAAMQKGLEHAPQSGRVPASPIGAALDLLRRFEGN